MQVSLRNMAGDQVGTVELPAGIFEVEVNTGLMHQAFVRQMANARLGTHKTKTRSEVRRTTAKWYRQKGTGRARHGARSAPIFVGGGVAHGPQPRSHAKDMPRKMRRQALRSALSVLAAGDQIVVVDELTLNSSKTSVMAKALNGLVGDNKALVLTTANDTSAEMSIRNLENADVLRAMYLNVRDLLSHDRIVISQAALLEIESYLGAESK